MAKCDLYNRMISFILVGIIPGIFTHLNRQRFMFMVSNSLPGIWKGIDHGDSHPQHSNRTGGMYESRLYDRKYTQQKHWCQRHLDLNRFSCKYTSWIFLVLWIFFVYILFWYGSQNVTGPSVTLPMAHVCSKCWSRSFENFAV